MTAKIDRRHQNPGGARKGSGGTVRRITISLESARTLKALLRAQIGGTYSAEAAAAWVESKINEAWGIPGASGSNRAAPGESPGATVLVTPSPLGSP